MNSASQRTISIAIADDHKMVREGIVKIINSFENFNVTIQADDGLELIQKLEIADTMPDICILDINMPRKNGWVTLAEIKQKWTSLKIVMLSVLGEVTVINTAITNGANGYICKSNDPDDLRDTLIKVYELGYFYPIGSSQTFLASVGSPAKAYLTSRELKFLEFCCEDSSYKEIADRMHVSPRTVEGYRDALFEKLSLRTRIGLVMYAIKNGIISFLERK